MIIFDMIMTLIEDLVMSFITADIFSPPYKKKYIIISTIFCFLETIVFDTVLQNNSILVIMVILSFAILISYQNKKVSLYYVIIPSIIMCLLLASNILSFVIITNILNVPLISITDKNITVVLVSLFSRIIFIINCLLFRKIEKKVNKGIDFNIQEWWIFTIFCFLIILVIGTLGEAIFYNRIGLKLIYTITIEFILMSISFLILYFKVKNNYKHNLELTNELLKNKYAKDIYSKTNKLSYQMFKDKHQMTYQLLKIKGMVEREEYEDIISYIDDILGNLDKYDKTPIVNQPIFEHSIDMVINQLKCDGYNVKFVFNVEENNKTLDNLDVIKGVIEYIQLFKEYSKETKKLELFVIQNDSYVVFKIYIPFVDEEIKFDSIKNMSFIKKRELIQKDNKIELRILIKN